jgi:hypothetical protein
MIFRFFSFFEYSILAYFFALNIKVLPFKKFLVFSIIPFFLFSVFDYMMSKREEFTFYPQIAECIVFIFVIVYIFYEKMETDLTVPIFQTYFFWASVAFLIFFGGNFVLFLFSKTTMQKSEDFKNQYHLILGTFTILKNILLCISVTLVKNTKIEVPSPSEALNKIDLGFFASNNKLTPQ